jgi:hypothetical protein
VRYGTFIYKQNSLYTRFVLFKFMAWGIWNKILNGIKTGFNIVRKALPIATKIGRGISDALGPGSKIGGFIGTATNFLDKGNDFLNGSNSGGGIGNFIGGGGSGRLKIKPF